MPTPSRFARSLAAVVSVIAAGALGSCGTTETSRGVVKPGAADAGDAEAGKANAATEVTGGSETAGSTSSGGVAPGAASGGSETAGSSSGGAGGANVSNGGDSNGGGLGFATCAATVSTAMPFPLDMYIMLDTSGSMSDAVATNVTKWDAVKSALETFLKDSSSAGLGIGLQYFPLAKAGAPASCQSDTDCAASGSGPCFTKWCYGAASTSGAVPCDQPSDCMAGGSDYGPCVTVSQCSNDAQYICSTPGLACNVQNAALGTCTAAPPNVCEHTANCDVASYATPATAIATLPAAATALIASIGSKMPAGQTPTGPALTGAIQQASAWATAHPTHRVVTVLATDGLPTECTPLAISDVAGVAAAGVSATPSIKTFVIGVFGSDDVAAGAPDNLNQIASKGGTDSAFIVDTTKDVPSQFLAALDVIRGARLACEFQIPQPAPGQTVQPFEVNVVLTSAGNVTTVGHVDDAAHCDATTGGWYYDNDPKKGGIPSKIEACPASCSELKAASNASVGIQVGCTTVSQ